MKQQPSNHTGRVAPLLAFTMLTASIAGNSVGADSNYYYLNNQRVALSPIAGQVLVQQAPNANRAAVASSLAVTETAIGTTGLAGWNRVTTPSITAANAKSATAQLATNAATFVAPVMTAAGGGQVSPSNAILVKYRAGTNPSATFASLKQPALKSQTQLGNSGIWQITTNLGDGYAVITLANQLHESGKFVFATPDFIQTVNPHVLPADPGFAQTWGLRNSGQTVNGRAGVAGFDMAAPTAWDLTTGSATIIVLVMDTGAQLNHPDLTISYGADFSGMGGGGGPVDSRDNHGTAVAGCIGAKHNGSGTVGIAPNVRIASAKIAGVDSNGYFINFRDSNVVNALSWAQGLGARVSNSSWGGGSASAAIESTFQSTKAAGMVHFASSGNSNASTVGWPSSSPHVISVGASANNGTRATFSSYGTDLEFLAPGEAILTCDRTGAAGYSTGDTALVNGTSFSSPYAAGVAALLLSREPNLTPDQVLARMRASCSDMGSAGRDNITGYGHLNATRVLGGNLPPSTPTDDHGNTFATATSISIPRSLSAVLEAANDIDVFRFSITNTTDVRVFSTGTIDMIGRLYDASGNQLSYSDDEAGNYQFTISRTLSPGTYYLAASGYSSSVVGAYGLTFEATSTAPTMVMNGNGYFIADGDASPTTGDGTIFGSVNTAGGFTRSIFTISNTGNAPLILNGSPVVNITGSGAGAFRVASLPVTNISPGNGSALAIDFAPPSSGTFTAVITIGNNTSSTSPYDFIIQGTAAFPTDGEGNARSTAKLVYRISNTPAGLEYSGDVDYFKFTLPGTRTVVAESLGGIDTYGYIEDANGRVLGQDDDSGDGTNFRIQLNNIPAGTYYIRVRGYSSTTTGGYTLSIH